MNTMTVKGAYAAFVKSLEKRGRKVHLNLRRGLFVLSSDCESYHDITLIEYPISCANARQSPRLVINRDWSSKNLPNSVAKKWRLKSVNPSLFDVIDLKLTFLPINLESLANALPLLIEHIEMGNRQGFEELLDYKTVSIAPLSIWSSAADTFAKTGEYAEPDPATTVRINRDGKELGSFYLSQTEVLLKLGEFTGRDLGQTDDCEEWTPLRQLIQSLRLKNGKKVLATSNQRAYLKKCGVAPWKGISNREASHIITSMTSKYGIAPGEWINKEPTDIQNSLINASCAESSPTATRGDVSLAIAKYFDE